MMMRRMDETRNLTVRLSQRAGRRASLVGVLSMVVVVGEGPVVLQKKRPLCPNSRSIIKCVHL